MRLKGSQVNTTYSIASDEMLIDVRLSVAVRPHELENGQALDVLKHELTALILAQIERQKPRQSVTVNSLTAVGQRKIEGD